MHALRDIRQRLGGQGHDLFALRKGERLKRPNACIITFIASIFGLLLIMPSPLGANGERTIALYNIHTKKTLRVVYKRNDRYVPAAMKQLNWHLRDWRRNEPIKMDPKLIDLVWALHTELGSRVPVHVISGYRSPATNAMLRRTRGGQARRSQHMLGKAMDVRFPDIPVRRLRYSALLREQGGVGYYPTSATPFVHVDTGRVRHWPRMGRQELALLFPSGRTRHRPRRGGPVTRQDAINARRSNPILARRVAMFHDLRRNGPNAIQSRTLIAAATPSPRDVPAPRLVQRPRVAQRPAVNPAPRPFKQRSSPSSRRQAALDAGGWQATLRRAQAAAPVPQRAAARAPFAKTGLDRSGSGPKPLPFRPPASSQNSFAIAAADRGRLARLTGAALGAPQPAVSEATQQRLPKPAEVALPNADQWIGAPAYDEEHPEELFYRPFPIAPFITLTASADDAALRKLTHPEIDKTLALLVDGDVADPPLQLRPGMLVANMMWSQSFKGWQNGHRPVVASTAAQQPPLNKRLGQRLVRLAGQ